MPNSTPSLPDWKHQKIEELQEDIYEFHFTRLRFEMSSFIDSLEEDEIEEDEDSSEDDQACESSFSFFKEENGDINEWERKQLDMIGEKLDRLLPDDDLEMRKIWAQLMEKETMQEAKFVSRLVCHNPSWVKRLPPILNEYTPPQIEKTFGRSLTGRDWPLAASRALCDIKLFKKYYAPHILSKLVGYDARNNRFPSYGGSNPADDMLWFINISDAPAHVAWRVIGLALQDPK